MEKHLSELHLDFSDDSLLAMNLALAFIMFGVSLSLKKESFKELSVNPKAVLTGMTAQFLLLPAATFLLIWFLEPLPGLALGMLLVASCPGGNVSNFFSYVAKGNLALSVTLTAIATLLAVVLMPLNFKFWSGLLPETPDSIINIGLDFFKMAKSVFLILVLPLIAGILFAQKFPKLTLKINKPVKIISFLILVAFIVVAFSNNIEIFREYIHYVIYLVLIHNVMAILLGYYFAKALGNSEADCKAISLETGIQNSGLGLVIIFTFFGGNGPMSLIAGWWGIWDIFTGLLIANIFANQHKILAPIKAIFKR